MAIREGRMRPTHFVWKIKNIYNDEYSDSEEDHQITTDVMDSADDPFVREST